MRHVAAAMRVELDIERGIADQRSGGKMKYFMKVRMIGPVMHCTQSRNLGPCHTNLSMLTRKDPT